MVGHAAIMRAAGSPSRRSGAGRNGSREGVDGLLRDKTRPPGKPPLRQGGDRAGGRADARRAAGRGDPLDRPGDGRGERHLAALGAAHLGGARPAAASGPRFKLSNDPEFAAKLHDVVGLYVDPPAHAVVLSVDEKSQIQALDRTQPGLPMKKGRAGTMTHDYIRNGTTTLFAALNVLDGTVIGQCMQRHRHQEFIRFLNAIERGGAGRQADPRDPRQLRHPQASQGARWLGRHPRWTFHFTPTSCSWLNAVEGFFSPADPPPPQARRLPLARRPAGRDQPLPRRAQRRSQTLHLDQTPRQILAKLTPLNAPVH